MNVEGQTGPWAKAVVSNHCSGEHKCSMSSLKVSSEKSKNSPNLMLKMKLLQSVISFYTILLPETLGLSIGPRSNRFCFQNCYISMYSCTIEV